MNTIATPSLPIKNHEIVKEVQSSKAVEMNPANTQMEMGDCVDALFAAALKLHQANEFDAASALYQRILDIDPKHFDATHLTGLLAYQQKNYDLGILWMTKAIEMNPINAGPYSNMGILYKDLEQYDLSLKYQSKALELDPYFYQAFYNRGNVYKILKQAELAIQDYTRSIVVNPHYVDAFVNRGIVHLDNKDFTAAMKDFEHAIGLNPQAANAHFNLGSLFTKIQRFDLALPRYRQAMALKPDIDFLLGEKIYSQLFSCDWSDLEEHSNLLASSLASNTKASAPLIVSAVLDSPQLQKTAAEIWTHQSYPENHVLGPITSHQRTGSQNGKIRIAYISSDFQNHPVCILLAQLFELHDRSRFEIFAFDSTKVKDPADSVRARIQKSFDHFIDIQHLSDEEAAKSIRKHHIDVAIDLGGHTLNSRMGILAHRVANVQISYIGYLGTLGASYIDYILADDTLIPEKTQKDYTEKIIYLPCYQVNDSNRKVSAKLFSREELGLPTEGFVYCCFNNNYKITPQVFESWMRILQSVPGSSLLILEDNAKAKENLLLSTARLGVDPSRLVFGQRLEASEYLARYKSADLFLDTHPYNAGTTASDALWVGLPVITRLGESFASRMAASALKGVGLEALITHTPHEYEQLAIALGLNSGRYKAIRDQLAINTKKAKLFDAREFTLNLEQAFENVVNHARAGHPPQTLRVV